MDSLPIANPWNDRQTHEILPNLYLSGLDGISSSLDRMALVVSVCEDKELPDISDVKHVKISVKDRSDAKLKPHFAAVSSLIQSHLEKKENVLVHCVAGASRSPTIVMAVLMNIKRVSLAEAYHLVKTKRRIVEPERGFLLQLLDWEKELFPDTKPSIDSKLGWPSIPDTREFLRL